MTMFFNTSEIHIYRHRRRSGTNRYVYSATYTAYQSDIQPAGQSRTEFVQGRLGTTFTAFVDASIELKEGDQIRTGGKTYSVKGIMRYEGAGLLDHLELTLVAQDG